MQIVSLHRLTDACFGLLSNQPPKMAMGQKDKVSKNPIGKRKKLPQNCGPAWGFLFDPLRHMSANLQGDDRSTYRLASLSWAAKV